MKELMKNISKSEVLTLRDQVLCQPGQVVSKTLAQNDALSITLFAFDKDEEISTHASGGDAFVTCLDGEGEITIDGDIAVSGTVVSDHTSPNMAGSPMPKAATKPDMTLNDRTAYLQNADASLGVSPSSRPMPAKTT